MVRDDWVVGGARNDAGAERIYAAATELIVRDGWDAFDIDTLAARVHCSRATVYRYAGGKAQIRDAVLMRLATDIIGNVQRAVVGLTGPDRVTVAITVALDQIRANPLRTLMLSTRMSLDLGEMHASPLLSRLAAELTGITDDPHAAQWVVRVVMSFAHWPMQDHREEQEFVRRFVAPAFE